MTHMSMSVEIAPFLAPGTKMVAAMSQDGTKMGDDVMIIFLPAG